MGTKGQEECHKLRNQGHANGLVHVSAKGDTRVDGSPGNASREFSRLLANLFSSWM